MDSNLPFANLIKILNSNILKIEQETNSYTSFIPTDFFNKLIPELHNLIIEHLNDAKNDDTIKFIEYTSKRVSRYIEDIEFYLERIRHVKELKLDYVKNNYSNLINEHYSIFEYEKLILPILALIHTSPRALNEFLNGEWKSFDLLFIANNETKNSEFLTKLIHITLVDLMCVPKLLKNSIVNALSFNSYIDSRFDFYQERSVQSTEDHREYYYNKIDNHYGELSYEEIMREESQPIKLQLKQIYEFYISLRFSINSSEDGSKISSALSHTFIPTIKQQFFTLHELNNIISLIEKLRDTRNPLYSHIRSLLSTKMQNIVLYCDLSSEPSIKLKKDLLDELSLVMLQPDLYQESIFDEIICSNEKLKKEEVEYISSLNISFKDLIQITHESTGRFITNQMLVFNQCLLYTVFKDEFDNSDIYF